MTLLSRNKTLATDAGRGLKALLTENERLKQLFGQLWDYNCEAWAREFFERWRAQLKWQRIEPHEKFARMIDVHWDGIAAY